MRTKTYILFSFIALIGLSSCEYFTLKKEDKNPVLARVFDSYLRLDDIANIIPKKISKEDSIVFVYNYTNTWARQKLMLKKAKLNLDQEKLTFDILVEKYKEDLYINKYKEAVVKQYLDTVVTSNDIEGFYDKNKQNFKLNEVLVQLKYIQFANDILNPSEFIKLFKSDKKEDLEELDDLSLQLKSASLNDSIWIRYSDVLNKIPFLKKEDSNKILKKSYIIQKKDSLGLYLVAIKDVLKRNDLAPISYISPTIKEIILHKRKLNLIKKLEETLTNDAIKNKEFEIFTEN